MLHDEESLMHIATSSTGLDNILGGPRRQGDGYGGPPKIKQYDDNCGNSYGNSKN